MKLVLALGTLAQCCAQDPPNDDANRPVFGITVVDTIGLEGKIYNIKVGQKVLPNFGRMKPVGSIYTSSLNVPPRDFLQGFPGVTKRTEWFAIDYSGKFWIGNPGKYKFSLLSDDGSKLYIDKKLVIDNDGTHAALLLYGAIVLKTGSHNMRVSYFQGPRTAVALVLKVAFEENRDFKIFNTRDFRPPLPK
jgi:PA14 domain